MKRLLILLLLVSAVCNAQEGLKTVTDVKRINDSTISVTYKLANGKTEKSTITLKTAKPIPIDTSLDIHYGKNGEYDTLFSKPKCEHIFVAVQPEEVVWDKTPIHYKVMSSTLELTVPVYGSPPFNDCDFCYIPEAPTPIKVVCLLCHKVKMQDIKIINTKK